MLKKRIVKIALFQRSIFPPMDAGDEYAYSAMLDDDDDLIAHVHLAWNPPATQSAPQLSQSMGYSTSSTAVVATSSQQQTGQSKGVKKKASNISHTDTDAANPRSIQTLFYTSAIEWRRIATEQNTKARFTYNKAVQAIKSYKDPIAKVNDLLKVPGIGQGMLNRFTAEMTTKGIVFDTPPPPPVQPQPQPAAKAPSLNRGVDSACLNI